MHANFDKGIECDGFENYNLPEANDQQPSLEELGPEYMEWLDEIENDVQPDDYRETYADYVQPMMFLQSLPEDFIRHERLGQRLSLSQEWYDEDRGIHLV